VTTEGNSRQLFAPAQIGPHRLQNRIVMAPLTRSRAIVLPHPNACLASAAKQSFNTGVTKQSFVTRGKFSAAVAAETAKNSGIM